MPRTNPCTTGRSNGRPSRRAAAPSVNQASTSASVTGRPAADSITSGNSSRARGDLKLLVQAEHELVPGEGRVQCFRPVAFSQFLAGERSNGPLHARPGTVLVFHRLDAAIEDGGGVFGGRRRNDPGRRRPDLGLIVLADRRHRIGRDAEEARGEVARRRRGPGGRRWSPRSRRRSYGRPPRCTTHEGAG